MEGNRIGNIFGDDKGTGFADNVWDKDHLSPTLNTMQGGYKQPMILESVNELGFMDNGTGKHQSNTVYDEKSLCPNITTIDGGGTQQIKIITENSVVAIDEQNMNVRTDTFGTLTTDGSSPKHNNRVMIKQATKQGYIECEVGGVADFSYPDSETRRGRVQDNGNTCPTLTAESQDICRIEQVGQISSDNSQYGTVIGENGLCSTLQAGTHGYANSCIATQYRIRKLTPRECWRLMDFSDEDFEKAEEVNSNTQLYKQAGNSIVKNVLIAIFGQMIPGKGMCYLEEK